MLSKWFRALGTACVAAMALVTLSACNGAREDAVRLADSDSGFHYKNLNGNGRKYTVFVPLNYDKNKKYPMIVFLHGIGEAGSDGKPPLRVGLAPFVADRASSFPFICLFPQSTGDWNENSQNATDVIAAIDEVSRTYSVDTDRISLTGLSTGGYGTWAIGAKYKSRFAALVPMGGYDDTKNIPNLTDIPIWAFHNSGDPFVMAGGTKNMVEKIKAAGGNANYTEYPAGGHNCWEETYSNGAVFEWLQQQRVSNRRPSKAGAAAPLPVAAKGSVTSAAPAKSNVPVEVNGSAIVTPY